jgi:hypothetical protein
VSSNQYASDKTLRLTSGRARLKTRHDVESFSSGPSPAKNFATKHGTDILSAAHLILTNMRHQTHEIRVSAVSVQVKNGWSYTSVPPIRLLGVRTRLLDLHILIRFYRRRTAPVPVAARSKA